MLEPVASPEVLDMVQGGLALFAQWIIAKKKGKIIL